MATNLDRPFIEVDSRERCDPLTKVADSVRLLTYGDRGQSYDIHIGRRSEPMDLRIERKRASDLIATLNKPGHLERQLRAVDILLYEFPQKGEFRTKDDHMAWSRAKKTLARLSLALPVIPSTGPAETVRLLEHLRDRPSLEVRERNIVGGADGLMAGIIRGVGLNPDKGGILESVLSVVNMDTIVRGLNWEQWDEIPGVGPKSMDKIRKRVRK